MKDLTIENLEKLKFPEIGTRKEYLSHPEGSFFNRGYNAAISNIQEWIATGIKPLWIDAPENPNNK